ncbi:hypothetical protein G7046_g101 [Stylonectria norvegica]|nr:hypothetical protein G7046_g101 [Stylonectria norvegica]
MASSADSNLLSLSLLPVEIQCSMIRLLDPIGLISLSQANSQFRALIKPTHTLLAERLLAYETLSQYGGVTPIFRARDNHIEPEMANEDWDTTFMRWACTKCLRLLSHKHFDNHSILRLGYRKPIPGSPAASAITSWEPSKCWRPRKCPRRQLIRRSVVQQMPWRFSEEREVRSRYCLAVTHNMGVYRDSGDPFVARNSLATYHGVGMEEFYGIGVLDFSMLTQEQEQAMLDREAYAVELMRCGYKRRLRRCNECRFRSGELKPRVDGSGGTVKVPVMVSRNLDFGTALDRYFPGFSDVFEHKRPGFNAPVNLIYRKNAHECSWTMRMVRCPGCEHWQELRAFRFGGMFHHWTPIADSPSYREGFQTWEQTLITRPVIDQLLCNHCFAQEHGRDELGQLVAKWLKVLVTSELWSLKRQLVWGWLKLFHSVKRLPQEYKAEVKAMLQDTRKSGYADDSELSRADTALLRMRHQQWMKLWERMQKEHPTNWIKEEEDDWFDRWMNYYDETDAHWNWLRGIKEEIDEKVDVLAEWALSRDGAALS